MLGQGHQRVRMRQLPALFKTRNTKTKNKTATLMKKETIDKAKSQGAENEWKHRHSRRQALWCRNTGSYYIIIGASGDTTIDRRPLY